MRSRERIQAPALEHGGEHELRRGELERFVESESELLARARVTHELRLGRDALPRLDVAEADDRLRWFREAGGEIEAGDEVVQHRDGQDVRRLIVDARDLHRERVKDRDQDWVRPRLDRVAGGERRGEFATQLCGDLVGGADPAAGRVGRSGQGGSLGRGGTTIVAPNCVGRNHLGGFHRRRPALMT